MEVDTESSNTSFEDKTEDFCDNPTRDALTEGLMLLIKPTVDQLDEKVRKIRISQIELKQQIECLSEDLKRIHEFLPDQETNLEIYIKKLISVKHTVTIVSNILQNCEERLRKIHQSIGKESSRHRAVVETETPTSENPSIQ